MGNGGAFEASGSVTPGIEGMRGGKEICGLGSGTGEPKARTAAKATARS